MAYGRFPPKTVILGLVPRMTVFTGVALLRNPYAITLNLIDQAGTYYSDIVMKYAERCYEGTAHFNPVSACIGIQRGIPGHDHGAGRNRKPFVVGSVYYKRLWTPACIGAGVPVRSA